jgi:hypothetical protein
MVETMTDFLEVAIHYILYLRNLYPRDTFSKKKMYGVPVWQNRHPGVRGYVAGLVGAAQREMKRVSLSDERSENQSEWSENELSERNEMAPRANTSEAISLEAVVGRPRIPRAQRECLFESAVGRASISASLSEAKRRRRLERGAIERSEE